MFPKVNLSFNMPASIDHFGTWFSQKEPLLMQSLPYKATGRTDHLETRALPEGLGSVGGPMRCPWYLFHRLF
ncbi:unnamed protein product [Staurois parvus]|uniref:Uncharacterized protein n=1 Tax=Staurois parvus TaxID=386267 RepID=A0ABN9CK26_9NEOB|nr:unnamed protein product [Staurois parvus]